MAQPPLLPLLPLLPALLALLTAAGPRAGASYFEADGSDEGLEEAPLLLLAADHPPGEAAGPSAAEPAAQLAGVAGAGPCQEGARCTGLRSCRLLADLLDRSCLSADRLRPLTCGYVGAEPLVCCPDSGDASPLPGPGRPRPRPPDPPSAAATAFSGDCGRRLVAGIDSGLGAQPWVARVAFKHTRTGRLTYPCCGTIVAPRTVLTAAHCALAKSDHYQLSEVVAGEYDGRGDPDCTRSYCALPAQRVPISHVVLHPGYEAATFKHDIALLVLKEALNYSLAARPVCIPVNPNVPLLGRRARLVGWGKLPGQDATSPRQQQLEVPLVPLERCADLYRHLLPITGRQLCAGGEAGRDACAGFGGAPLILLDQTTSTRHYQVGMASFGSDKCGAANVPSVYTNTIKYSTWIKSNIVS